MKKRFSSAMIFNHYDVKLSNLLPFAFIYFTETALNRFVCLLRSALSIAACERGLE